MATFSDDYVHCDKCGVWYNYTLGHICFKEVEDKNIEILEKLDKLENHLVFLERLIKLYGH